MITLRTPFSALTAAELMSHTIVTIPEGMTLRAAAQRLRAEGISGAPVVDAKGRCVGILTASDFLALWGQDANRANEAVNLHMTTDLVTAPPSTSITDLARMMIDAHIHRVVVVDAERRPLGVVSSTNILAAVAYKKWLRRI